MCICRLFCGLCANIWWATTNKTHNFRNNNEQQKQQRIELNSKDFFGFAQNQTKTIEYTESRETRNPYNISYFANVSHLFMFNAAYSHAIVAATHSHTHAHTRQYTNKYAACTNNSKYTRNNCIKCTFKVSTLPMCNVHNVWQIKADGMKDIHEKNNMYERTKIRTTTSQIYIRLHTLSQTHIWATLCTKLTEEEKPTWRYRGKYILQQQKPNRKKNRFPPVQVPSCTAN